MSFNHTHTIMPTDHRPIMSNRTTRNHKQVSARSLLIMRIPDIILIAIFVAGVYVMDKITVVWQRPFRLNDPDISYEHVKSDIVPATSVIWIAVIAPVAFVAIWCIIWTILLKSKMRTANSKLYELVGRPVSKGPVWHFISFIIGHLFTIAVTLLITEFAKRQVGRLRPDFLYRCKPILAPSLNDSISSERNPLISNVYYNQSICSGDPDEIKEGRLSFPSGHSSGSFSGLGFVSLWLFSILRPLPFFVVKSRRFPLSTGHGLRMALSITPLLIASYIAISRLQQNVHNPTDIIGGGIIGFVSALFFWYLYVESELIYANKLERKRHTKKKLEELFSDEDDELMYHDRVNQESESTRAIINSGLPGDEVIDIDDNGSSVPSAGYGNRSISGQQYTTSNPDPILRGNNVNNGPLMDIQRHSNRPTATPQGHYSITTLPNQQQYAAAVDRIIN